MVQIKLTKHCGRELVESIHSGKEWHKRRIQMERRIYSSSDGEQMNAAEAQLRAKGLDESVQHLVDILDGYFQVNLGVPVTVAAIVKLIEAQPGLKWLSLAELEYRKIEAENTAAAV